MHARQNEGLPQASGPKVERQADLATGAVLRPVTG
jgi:hypothetical protein